MTQKRVLVLKGGLSAEREVSLVSGQACVEALGRCGYIVQAFDPAEGLAALVQAMDPSPDVVFNALHGRWGEDGCVQGALNLMGVPYTHSGLLASAMAMDKAVARDMLAAAGLRCAPGRVCRREDFEGGEPLPRPFVVKPVSEGSSKGVHIVKEGDALGISEEDWAFGDTVLVEAFIPGRELTVAVMGDRALAVTELRTHGGFYDYEAKYEAGRTEHLVPAPIPEAVRDEAMRQALVAHQVLRCRGMTRTDFRYDDRSEAGEAGGLYVLETNTQPGMTPLSLAPEQAAYVGIDFDALVRWLVENASCD